MRYFGFLLIASIFVAPLFSFEGDSPKAGDPAPAFELPGSDGKTYTVAQFQGEKPVVLAWFPKAFTSG